MVNSITTSYIRGLCDKLGYTSSIDSDGDICVRLSADEDFGHDVLVFFSVSDKSTLRVFGLADFTVEQRDVAKTLIKLNEYNCSTIYLRGLLQKNGRVMVDRSEFLDEAVSEEFIIENCIKVNLSFIWAFFKENFSEY